MSDAGALTPGARVDMHSVGPGEVVRELGEGSQGCVYEVVTASGRSLAVKWYKPRSATDEQHDALASLVRRGSPHPRFLWPLSMVTCDGMPGFGYAMPLRDPRYVGLAHLLSGEGPDGERLEVSFRAVITLCRQLSECFYALHAHGLCYRDVNFGNVFFDPATGDVAVCDNDNVGVDDGEARILGTPYFMAPELVRPPLGDVLPDTQTDRYSLAVLLFYALMVSHPLEGARTDRGLRDEDWLVENFGRDPVFVFDPDDASNRPLARHTEAYWAAYPQFLRALFTRAFTEGLHDPAARIVETEWVRATGRLLDSMQRCPGCAQTNFFDPEHRRRACLGCGHPLPDPLLLRVRRHTVVLTPDTCVYADRLDRRGDSSLPVGRVRSHVGEPDRLALENLTQHPWRLALPDGRGGIVAPGAAVDLEPGLHLHLGQAHAYVTG